MALIMLLVLLLLDTLMPFPNKYPRSGRRSKWHGVFVSIVVDNMTKFLSFGCAWGTSQNGDRVWLSHFAGHSDGMWYE